jgi:hypothetical protein
VGRITAASGEGPKSTRRAHLPKPPLHSVGGQLARERQRGQGRAKRRPLHIMGANRVQQKREKGKEKAPLWGGLKREPLKEGLYIKGYWHRNAVWSVSSGMARDGSASRVVWFTVSWSPVRVTTGRSCTVRPPISSTVMSAAWEPSSRVGAL